MQSCSCLMDNSLAGKSSLGCNCDDNGPEPSALRKQYTNGTNGLGTILQLKHTVHGKFQVKDEISETSDAPSDDDGNSGSGEENVCSHDLNMDGPSAMTTKCFQKCASFPVSACSDGSKPESHLEDSKGLTRSLSMPAVKKPVSAMKGSREKEGGPQKKLSVSWAPDVYDPPPTSVSHFPNKRNQPKYSKNHKKHGKGKQKGKSSRGGASAPKEKKHHHRKSSGRSDSCSDSYSDPSKAHNYKSSLELLDFNDPGIGGPIPDLNCGSKFLGQESGTVHCVY